MNIGCPEMANLAYIEGDVPILGLDHFVHVHIPTCGTRSFFIYNVWPQGDPVT
jgi:hypothetical protein